ncbi:CRISPR-associated endoribonuclease Cas6 [Caldithrix abyssi]
MRIKISLAFDGYLFLDYQYPLLLRALIYHLLPEKYASHLHDAGFMYEKRRFKLFTFSRIFGPRVRSAESNGKPLVFKKEIHFYMASPVTKILEYVANESIRRTELRLGTNRVNLKSIEVEKEPIFSDRVKIRMLSPMTIRSTLITADGKKKSYYYNPQEQEFSELMRKNLEKKYQVVFKSELRGDLAIVPLGRGKERILRGDRGFIIKGWDGLYELRGTPELIQLSYSTGLGEKNSLGLGMWEEVI